MYKYQGFTAPLWSWRGASDAEASLKELIATGANAVIIDAHLLTSSMTATDIQYEYPEVKTDLDAAIKLARKLGLDVWFKPIVIVGSGPDRHQWQLLEPSDLAKWFASYKAILNDIAPVLQANGVSHFLLTNELHSLTTSSANTAHWIDLISSVRTKFSGKLGFNCGALLHPFETGNEMLKVPQAVFDQLDFIGLSSYPRVAKGVITVDSVEQGWLKSAFDQNLFEILSQFVSNQSLPIYFTELGSPAYAGGNWQYGTNFTEDLISQANFYTGTLPLLTKYFANEINGVFVYNWLFNERPDSMQNIGVSSPYDWNVNEKPAEIAITQQFSKPTQIGTVDIHALPFSQNISGTPGVDRVVFPENFELAVVQHAPSSTSVRLPGKAYSLQNVERIQFQDKSLALDLAAAAGKAYRVYKAAFNRDPSNGDAKGLGYWIGQIDKGMDLIEVSARFVDSKEFRDLYGTNPTNAQFLTKLYQNVLGRDPEATGYNWWLNELNTNPSKTKAKALADFAESGENQAGVASLIGSGITYEPWVN